MGKSARVLGWEFGRTAREMNVLLKEHGYLSGSPSAYRLTEKGQQYAVEQHHSRGTGGSAQYNPHWETRTWNDETAAALKADMETDPEGFHAEDSPPDEKDDFAYGPLQDFGGIDDDDYEPPRTWKDVALEIAVEAAFLAAPHVKPFWNNQVKPAAKKLRVRFAKQASVESRDS